MVIPTIDHSDEQQTKSRLAHARTLGAKLKFDHETYEVDSSFQESDLSSPDSLHTTSELRAFVEKNENIQIDGTFLNIDAKGKLTRARLGGRQSFLEKMAAGEKLGSRMREDYFGMNGRNEEFFGDLVGQETISLMGGPFHKQLYMQDYLRMNGACFFAYHHDPMARRATEIMRDFTLGRGYRIDCDNQAGQALIRAFEEVNNLPELMDYFALELSAYGETLIWQLPGNATHIGQQLRPGESVPRGLIPRFRLVDPSCIWEIVTYPEDIQRKLFYQWVSSTQYQTYTGVDPSSGQQVQTSKFIFQQIPADEMMHFKVNSVSNEKRGRSDLFPALGYMRRLRDSVNYAVISLQKQAAWSLDVEIDGSQEDIDAYVEAQRAMGTIPPAGSEWVHSKAVQRKYLSNEAGRAGSSEALDWSLSMIAAATGIPLQYFGTHLSNSGTRASALVSTEPVAKKFERRQLVYKVAIEQMIRRLFRSFGIPEDTEIEVTFPDIVTQDRAQKLKDLAGAQFNGWISRRRAAEIAAKELGISKFDYEKELLEISAESSDAFAKETQTNPLTTPGIDAESTANSEFGGGGSALQNSQNSGGMSSGERKEATNEDRSL